jgi:hypothetical protein
MDDSTLQNSIFAILTRYEGKQKTNMGRIATRIPATKTKRPWNSRDKYVDDQQKGRHRISTGKFPTAATVKGNG